MTAGAGPLDIAQLVADHHEAVYRYAYRLAGSAADAEDLTQQVFLVAQQKLEQIRDASCARSWLYSVLRNSYLRGRRQRRPVSASAVDVRLEDVADDETPSLDARIEGAMLQAAINELPDEFKMAVLMFYFEHRSYREIAAELEIPLGTVMSRLARAKQQIRRCLGEPAEEQRSSVLRPDKARVAVGEASDLGPRA